MGVLETCICISATLHPYGGKDGLLAFWMRDTLARLQFCII